MTVTIQNLIINLDGGVIRWITHSHCCMVSEKVQIILTSYPTGSFFVYGSFTVLPTVI
jgi:hypothetical protein